MSWVHDYAVTEGTVAASSTGSANMPEHQANDMLITFAAKDSTGALTESSSSGWTALSSGAGGAQWVGAWWKRASSSTETPPSFTLTSDEYNIVVVSVRGAHTSTAPTSAISTDDSTMTGGGYLVDQTLNSTANGIILFGAGTDTGMGVEPMPGYGQVLYAGDASTCGCGVWWQFFKNAGVSTSAYYCFGAIADNCRTVKVLVPDDGSNSYEPGRIDLTSTFHTLYGGPWGGTTYTGPDTTWTLPASSSISMLGSDFNQVWTYDGVSTWADKTEDARDDGTGDIVITNNNNTAIYFGSNTTFNSACIDVGTAASGTSVGTWEYSTGGGGWSTLTVVDWPNATSWASTWLVAGLGTIKFTPPSNWAKNVVNTDTGDGYYYIRRVVTDNWATSGPTLDQVLKDGRPLVYDAATGTADSGINPYHLSYSATPAAGTATTYLQHSGGENVASVVLGDTNRVFGIPDWSSGYLLTSFMLQLPRDLIDLGFYDLHKGAAITLMDTGIAARNNTSGSSSTDASTYTTASVTMKAGLLYLMCVENSHGSSATAVGSITATGGGAPTFTSRSTTQFNSSLNRISIWSCVPGSDYTGTLDIDFSGTTQTGAAWSLNEFRGVDTTTNDGVVQQAVGTGSSTTPLATLGTFSSIYNATVGAFGQAAAAGGTPSSGYTEITDVTAATPAQALQVVYRFDNDTTVDETITSAAWGACAVELDATAVTSNNRITWICGAKDSPDQIAAKKKVVGIQPSQTIDTAWARHGTLDTSAIDTFLGSASAPFGATAANWSILMKAGNHILAGGTSTTPLTFQQAADALINGSQLFPVWEVDGDVALIWHPTQFGGGDDLHIDCDLKVFQFPERADIYEKTTRWHVDDNQVGFDFNGQSGDTVKFTNCLFTGVTPYYWRLNSSANSGANWDFSGSTIVGVTVTLRSVYTFTTMTFNNCSEIALNGADITSTTIRDTRATTSQGAVAITSVAEGDGLTDLTFIDNNDGDIGHSIRITATGTYTFNGHTFSGGGPAKRNFNTGTGVNSGTDIVTTDSVHGYADGDAIYYQDQGGSVNMGLTDGTLYYVNSQSTTTLSFHTSKASAIADTSRVNLTSSGSETHYIYSAKADVFVDVAGSTIINVVNGGDTPTIRERDGATVTVQNPVTVKVTVKDADTLEVIESTRVLLEADSIATGSHTGSDNASTLTDSTKSFTTNALVNYRIYNTTDGSDGLITANTATTVTATLTGGTENDWDTSDAYIIVAKPALNPVSITRLDTTATVTHRNHGLSSGATVVIRGATQDQYNGIFTISNVSTNAYDYTMTSDPGASASGSPTSTAVILSGTTNASGIIQTTSFNYTINQPTTGKVRKATSGTLYKTGAITGTITSAGLDTTVLLISDS